MSRRRRWAQQICLDSRPIRFVRREINATARILERGYPRTQTAIQGWACSTTIPNASGRRSNTCWNRKSRHLHSVMPCETSLYINKPKESPAFVRFDGEVNRTFVLLRFFLGDLLLRLVLNLYLHHVL